MKIVAGLSVIQVWFVCAVCSPYRGKCARIGNFPSPIKDYVLAGHVISKSQVPSRIDCSFNCLSDQRCVSYNYEEGNKAIHECELNSESKETKSSNLTSKQGYFYHGTEKNVPSGCASSPCVNDGTCEDSCMKGSGFKCLCIEGRTGDKCQDWTSTAQDYEVVFSKESDTDYIESEINQPLSQFTLCLWVNLTSSGWSTFFSHMTSADDEELMFRCENMKWCQLGLIRETKSFYVIPFNDGLWHHICVSWENGQGLWDVLIDGAVIARGSNWHRTLNLRPGKLVVGQRQTFLGGGFTLSDSFAGKVAFVNLWRTKIAKSKIKEMAKSCSPELGNVTDWRMFRHGTQGDAEIRSPQSCVSGIADNEFLLDYPSRDNTSYIETTISQTLSEFTISFWMKRGYDGLLSAGIISYATTQLLLSLSIHLGSIGGFNLKISGDENNRYYLQPIVDELWHHLCITWSNEDGKSQVFLDGVLKKTMLGFRNNVMVPSGGILRIGQQQSVFGGNHNPSQRYLGKFAHFNIWSFVLPNPVITALSQGPGTENGDVISWRNLRTKTHGNVMAQEVADIQLAGAQENDFDLHFTTKSTANYAVYDAMPSLTSVTASAWIRLTHVSIHYIFTYASSDSNEAIGLGYNADDVRLWFNINAAAWKFLDLSHSLHDNGWHHVSFTWTNVDGDLCPFVNGGRLDCFTSYKTGQTIQGNGKFILGQEQDAYGGAFDSNQAFYGKMSRVNVWSYVLSRSVIKEMAKGCGLWSGDAIAWFHFKSSTFGAVQVVKPSSCSLAVSTVQDIRDAYCQSRYSSNPSAGCGASLRAAFDRKHNQVGKRWRCFYDVALIQDSDSNLYVYDTAQLSTCIHSIESTLLALVE